MKRSFVIRRQAIQQPLAEHRWDRLYQLLLRWSRATELEDSVPCSQSMEGEDESRYLRASFDPAPSPVADH